MKGWILGFLCLFLVGCTTPQIVYDDLNLIKENTAIQKEIAVMLLDSVKPKNEQQIEAIIKKRIEIEGQYDRITSAINRLIIYFEAEKDVGYIFNAYDFANNSQIKDLIEQAMGKKEIGK